MRFASPRPRRNLDHRLYIEPGTRDCVFLNGHRFVRHLRQVLKEGEQVDAQDCLVCTHCNGWMYDWGHSGSIQYSPWPPSPQQLGSAVLDPPYVIRKRRG